MSVDTAIINASSQIQLILVFITVLFNILYFEFNKLLNQTTKRGDTQYNDKFLNKLKWLRNQEIFLLIILLVSIFLFLPIFFQIICDFTNTWIIDWFTITRSSFFLITLLLISFLVIEIGFLKKTLDKIKETRKSADDIKKSLDKPKA